IVHQDACGAEGRRTGLREGRALLRVGDVESGGKGLAAGAGDLVCQPGNTGRINVAKANRRPFPCQAQSDGPPVSLRGTGHDGNISLQQLGHRFTPGIRVLRMSSSFNKMATSEMQGNVCLLSVFWRKRRCQAAYSDSSDGRGSCVSYL